MQPGRASRSGKCNKALQFARHRDRTIDMDQMRQRLSKSALAITLTELSAMAAPATTGFR